MMKTNFISTQWNKTFCDVTCRDKRHIRYNSITIHYKIVYYNFCVRQAKKKKDCFFRHQHTVSNAIAFIGFVAVL